MALAIVEKQYKNNTYRNIKINDLDYGSTIKVRLVFDGAKVFKSPFKTQNGGEKDNYNYRVLILEPSMGEVSFFAPRHLHNDLAKYKKGDVLSITATPKEHEYGTGADKRKVTFKGYTVTREELKLSDSDLQSIVDEIKKLPEKPTNELIKHVLEANGFKNDEDYERVLSMLTQ